MSVIGRHLLARSSLRTLQALLLLWPFALVGFLDRTVGSINPLVAARPGLALRIAAALSAPVVFALAAVGGMVLLAAELDRERESVAIQLAGRSPRRAALVTLLPALVLSAVSLAAMSRHHPAALETVYGTEWVRAEDVQQVLGRLDDLPVQSGVALSGRAEKGELRDVFLAVGGADEGFLAVRAKRAEAQQSDEHALQLHLQEGVAAELGESALAFDRAQLTLPLAGLVEGWRTWQRPSARPWSRLDADADLAGRLSGESAQRMSRRYRFEPVYRCTTALLPLLAAAQVLFLCFGARPSERRGIDLLFLCVCIVLLLGQLHGAAKSLAGSRPLLAYLCVALEPVAPAAVTTGLLRVWRRATAWRT